MFEANRDQLRNTIVSAWQRYRQKAPLQPLQQQIALIVERHPEYHRMLAQPDAAQREFPVEDGQVNPFLHLAMHIAIDEQRSTDRPFGFASLYAELASRVGDEHELQHRIMDVLGQIMWEAQRAGRPPDHEAYLRQLRERLG
ncbi:MAG: DUF1841 family protein [Gammaproteobacteria bacterium]|nr:DUF1841 family protein [Gammaproteobacteria bacterium]